MKTLNVSTAKAALIALTDRKTQQYPVSKSSQAYKTAMAAVEAPGVEQICGKSTGSGKHTSSTSWQQQTAIILRRAGIEFEIYNVAPKGGKHGDRIKVTL